MKQELKIKQCPTLSNFWKAETWSDKRDDLRQEEEKMKPMREHQQKASEWLETWQKMISYCKSVNSLQCLYPEIERQSEEFADLQNIIEELLQTFQQRWQELSSQQC